MPKNGFIGFITSQGFFIGIIFAVLKFDDAIKILFATLTITALFYLLGQISISYFFRTLVIKGENFPTMDYEYMLDEYSKAIEKKENIFNEYDPLLFTKIDNPKIIVKDEFKTIKDKKGEK